MRISDWSSDLCSSDLHRLHQQTKGLTCKEFFALMETTGDLECENLQCVLVSGRGQSAEKAIAAIEDKYFAAVTIEETESLVSFLRSEARSVGKAGVCKCRSGWSRYHKKKTKKK